LNGLAWPQAQKLIADYFSEEGAKTALEQAQSSSEKKRKGPEPPSSQGKKGNFRHFPQQHRSNRKENS
jgi:hypothetical protein